MDQNFKKDLFIQKIFSEVANKYDFMNDLMSFGLHRVWKKRLISKIKNLNTSILDVATGTGDIVLYINEKSKNFGANTSVTACDPNFEMLEICREKVFDKNVKNFSSCVANAEKLPFEDNSFDFYVISFGIRNVSSITSMMREAYRVLKPMGKFLSLEFTRPQQDFLSYFKDIYLSCVIPKLGRFIAGNEEAYSYLSDSIKSFYSSEELRSFIQNVGFLNVGFEEMHFKVASIHFGIKYG